VLVEDYDIEVFTPPCEPGAARFAARARLCTDISDVMPYLNATLRGAVYLPAAQALLWKKAGHNIAFHPYEVASSNVEDRQAAEAELRSMIDLVNRAWEQRAEITPDFQTHQRPTPMAVFEHLPHTNCKRCGSPTCFTFALRLAAAQVGVESCTPLLEAGSAGNLEALRAMLPDMPGIG